MTSEFVRQPTVARTPFTAIPLAPVESIAHKILAGLAMGLDDVNVVSKFIGDNFAGTPVATIFKLLGPAAGIGAAVLHRHLTNTGFDLSSLKDAEIL